MHAFGMPFFVYCFLCPQVPFEAVDVWVPLARQETGGRVVLFHAGDALKRCATAFKMPRNDAQRDRCELQFGC
jgi:hypothetical protein